MLSEESERKYPDDSGKRKQETSFATADMWQSIWEIIRLFMRAILLNIQKAASRFPITQVIRRFLQSADWFKREDTETFICRNVSFLFQRKLRSYEIKTLRENHTAAEQKIPLMCSAAGGESCKAGSFLAWKG